MRASSLIFKTRNFISNVKPKRFISTFSIGRLNHVAIAVPNLSQATTFYRETLGAKVSSPVDLPEHGVTTVFVDLNNTKIELLHPLGSQSPIENFLKKNTAGGIHHYCVEVKDIHEAIGQMKAKGVRCLSEEPKIGAHGKPVVFLHPKDCNGVLIELEETK
jgi:methylmalonyl-CoA/ethylmalonyl-CoA epimerase